MKTDLPIKAQIALRAAEILEERGLRKDGTPGLDGGPICPTKAICAAAKELNDLRLLGVRELIYGSIMWPRYATLPEVTTEMAAAKLREEGFK